MEDRDYKEGTEEISSLVVPEARDLTAEQKVLVAEVRSVARRLNQRHLWQEGDFDLASI